MGNKIDFTTKHEDMLTEHGKRLCKIDARFDKVDAKFDKIDARFAQVDARFEQIDARFDSLEKKVSENGNEIHRLGLEFEQQRNTLNIVLENVLSMNERQLKWEARWEENRVTLDNHENRISAVESSVKTLKTQL